MFQNRDIAEESKEACIFYKNIKAAASAGDQSAVLTVAMMFYYGIEYLKNIKIAKEWLKEIINQKENSSGKLFVKGFCYEKGFFGSKKNKTKAIEYYQREEVQNLVEAQFRLGRCYKNGCGVTKDEKAAVEWFKKAADQKHARAQDKLGYCYARGIGVTKDKSKAFFYLRKGAIYSDSVALYNYGCCYLRGIGCEKDKDVGFMWLGRAARLGQIDALGYCYEQSIGGYLKNIEIAMHWYRKAAEEGHPFPQVKLGVYLLESELQRDKEEGIKWLKKSAAQGNARAKCVLGLHYEKGRGVVAKDEAMAVEFYRSAAQQGYARAQYLLAICYREGIGVGKDKKMEFEWIKKAGKKGWSPAQCALGNFYRLGEVILKDEEKALYYYEKAARKGYAEAQNNLALYYLHGNVVAKNTAIGLNLCLAAADQGLVQAQLAMGASYEVGFFGIERDNEKAIEYYMLAADQGSIKAKAALNRLRVKQKVLTTVASFRDNGYSISLFPSSNDFGIGSPTNDISTIFCNKR